MGFPVLTRSVRMKQKISSTDRAACAGAPSLRACGSGEARNAEKTARGGQTVPPGHIFGWARGSIGRGRIARGGPSGTAAAAFWDRLLVYNWRRRRSRTDDGGTDRLGHAGTSLERCDGDDRDARGARAEDDTSFRPAKLVHARVSGADARVVFSRSTVWRLGHPSADPRPADSRAPPSAFSSPTAAVRAEQGVS